MSTTTFKEYQIETTPVIVPHALKGGFSQMRLALEALVAGKIGDSFVAQKPPGTVLFAARVLGLKLIYRCVTPEEKVYKKRKFRYWRCDGKTMDELNAIILKRQKGEEVKSDPVIPPSEEALEKLKARRHPK